MNRQTASSFIAGLVFGLGLILAGMANPQKVLAFLDLVGAWDPSLALVMAAAVAVASVGFALVGKRRHSLLGEPVRLPRGGKVDRRLLLGGFGFGVGWGLAGFCPGPAVVAIGAGSVKGLVFVAAMLAGMGLFEIIERRRAAS